jgi:predicted transcriptional regulator
MTTTPNTKSEMPVGQRLRSRRDELGVSRAALAGLANCSVAFLANVEQGYSPKRSRALQQAWAALDRIEANATVE